MSANKSGYVTGIGYPTTHVWSGNISYSNFPNPNDEQFDYGKKATTNYRLNVNVAHTHTLPSSYIYGSTDYTEPTFIGSAGTTESNGSGTDFSIMPPYVVKYCFERIA